MVMRHYIGAFERLRREWLEIVVKIGCRFPPVPWGACYVLVANPQIQGSEVFDWSAKYQPTNSRVKCFQSCSWFTYEQ